jgi:diguanylate cyclase (GGDEF)-like protein
MPVIHERPAIGEAHELLGFERALFWLRLTAAATILALAAGAHLVSPLLVAAAVAVVLGAAIAQRFTLRDGLPLEDLRRQAAILLVADVVAVYLTGTAFAAEAEWMAFYFYPLLSLEATVVGGMGAGVAVTAASIVAYGLQLLIHLSYGHAASSRSIAGAVGIIALTGGLMAGSALINDRGRRDLRALLDLTTALAQQQQEEETLELLDRRLHEAVGGRVRSVALRDPDGNFLLVRWHSPERRRLDREAVEQVLGSIDPLFARFANGVSMTYAVEAGSPLIPALGVPDWVRGITLVPIFLEGRWVGVLPVLWATPTVPDASQLRLLYGLASQMGLSLAQGQLQRIRAEAATDPLTQLLNRRAISEELAAYVARARRSNGHAAVLFCDLDGFKAVNDLRGHEAGDDVLRLVGAALRGAIRQGDVVGRYGGDEILVVAADADADDGVLLAQRVRRAVVEAAGDHGVDVTVGVAVFPSDGDTAADLMVAADQAMYRGKLRGPGNVMVAGEDGPRAISAIA